VLESASVSYGKATPYFPVVDLLKRYVHVEDADEPRTIRAKVTGQVLTLDETLQETIPALLWLLDVLPDDSPFRTLEPPQRRQRTLEALKRVLLRESQVQPLLLVFEDLHWIDTETQALLDSLIDSMPTARLLLLVNYRPEYQHGWGSKTYYTQLRLDPLPPASAGTFLDALLGQDPSLAPLKRLLIARTEGNPFFLEESVRTLVETRVLVGEPGAYRLAQSLPIIQVPATVQAVLAARIDRLPPEEKQLLQAAAVIGTEVPLPLLQAIAELPEAALHRGLTHLQAAEFLYETRLFPERAYTFKHALTQQVAYQSLLTSTRQRYHAQLAQALAVRPETVETQPELLAHHYTEAGLSEQAVGYWQRAGQHAIQRSAHAEAIAHLNKGLELLKLLPDSPKRLQQELDLQTALGPALMATKGFAAPEVEHAYARARELCRRIEDTPQLFRVLWGLRLFYLLRAEYGTARELGEQLLSLAQRAQDSALLLLSHLAVGDLRFHVGELATARPYLEQAVALYDLQQHRSLAFLYSTIDPGVASLSFTASTLWFLGYPAQAVERIRQALSLAQELSHPHSRAFALSFAAWLHQCQREKQATQERAEVVIALAAEQGLPYWVAQGTILRGWALAEQGQEEDGITQMRQGLADRRATGAELLGPYYLALLAEAYGKGGWAGEGLAVLSEALAAVDNSGERLYEAELYRLKGEILLTQEGKGQKAEEAEARFQQALAVARRQQAKSLELRAAMSLSRLWQQQGKRAEARELLAPIYNWFTEGFDTADLQEARALLEHLGT
jgi:predicted ATPase